MSKRHRSSREKPVLVVVPCAGGCGKTQSVRARRVRPADYYVCGAAGCRPVEQPVPEGMVLVHEYGAAGGFTGLTLREATSEESESIVRARHIRDVAVAMPAARGN